MSATGAERQGEVERLVERAQGHAMLGEYDDAKACLNEALRRRPDATVLRLHLGAVEEMAGRPDRAEAAYAAIVAEVPHFAPGYDALARIQTQRAKPVDAEQTCRAGLSRFPEFAALHATFGNLLQSLARLPEAEAAYLQSLRLRPGDAGVLNNLGLTRKQAGDLQGALTVLQEAVRVAPDFLQALLNLSDTLTRLGRPAEAAKVFRACLQHHPRNGTAAAFLGLALRDAGETAAANRLTDPGFVRQDTLGCPDGFSSAAAFHAALAEEVTAIPSRHSEPGTADGRQTRELFPPQTPALKALHGVFDRAVRAYADSLASDPSHPFLAHIPKQWRLSSWATLMRRVTDPEITHLHPESWLSGVCYISLPGTVADEHAQDGWLEFGRPPFNLHHTVEPPISTCQPESGKLVMFPGYYFHRIRPFVGDSVRISIAFDAVPA